MALDEANQLTALLSALDALRQEVARLGDRVAAVEAVAGTRPTPAAIKPSPKVVECVSEDRCVNEDLLAAISAAIAAYLGVKPHIRQISLVGGAFWAQQGRATIQASHILAPRHS